MSEYNFNGSISSRTEEVVAIYKEACHLRGRLGGFLQRVALPSPLVLAAGEAEGVAVDLLATVESLLGESIKADA